MTQWITRYVSVYFWLPVADLFSCILAKIQVLMLQKDIAEFESNPNFSIDASNSTYIIFMLIGIVGYFTIPTVANWIISSGGIGNYNKNMAGGAAKAGAVAGAAAGNITGRLRGR
jgi:conjugative transposon TraJ protein